MPWFRVIRPVARSRVGLRIALALTLAAWGTSTDFGGRPATAGEFTEATIRDIARRFSEAQIREKIRDAERGKSAVMRQAMNPNLPASQLATLTSAIGEYSKAIRAYEKALRYKRESGGGGRGPDDEDSTDMPEQDDDQGSDPPTPSPRPTPPPPRAPTPAEVAEAEAQARRARDEAIARSYEEAIQELDEVESKLRDTRNEAERDARSLLTGDGSSLDTFDDLALPFDRPLAAADAGASAYESRIRSLLPNDEWRSALSRLPQPAWPFGVPDDGPTGGAAPSIDLSYHPGLIVFDRARPPTKLDGWLDTFDRIAGPDGHAEIKPYGDEWTTALDREVAGSMTQAVAPSSWTRSDVFGALLDRGRTGGERRASGAVATEEEVEEAAADVFEWAMTQGTTERGRLTLRFPSIQRFYRYSSELLDRYGKFWDLAWTRFQD